MRLRTLTLVVASATQLIVAPAHAAGAHRTLRAPEGRIRPRWSGVPSADSRAAIALRTARAQLGKPYHYGSGGPDSFDCSGLTSFAWAAAGVQLPHSSSGQYASLPHVAREDLQPGDLVFSGGRRIGHVGIYIGDGQMIHAPETGKRVEIAPLQRNYVGAARPGI